MRRFLFASATKDLWRSCNSTYWKLISVVDLHRDSRNQSAGWHTCAVDSYALDWQCATVLCNWRWSCSWCCCDEDGGIGIRVCILGLQKLFQNMQSRAVLEKHNILLHHTHKQLWDIINKFSKKKDIQQTCCKVIQLPDANTIPNFKTCMVSIKINPYKTCENQIVCVKQIT